MGKLEIIDHEETQVNIENLKRKIDRLLLSHNVTDDIVLDVNDEKGEYSLSSEGMKLSIRINKNWIGYELEIQKSILGKSIGTFSDTDNYPIQGDNAVMALKVFDEVYYCLQGVLKNEIYVGKHKGKLDLAIPIGDQEFKVIERNNFFTGSSRLTSKEEVEKDTNLQRLFNF